MAVVPITQLALTRSKRHLRRALQQRDWHSLMAVDLELGARLASATDDPHRDQGELLRELRNILRLYTDVVDTCRDEVNAAAADAGLGQ